MAHRDVLWMEDDATPGTEGHVTIQQAWKEHFQEALNTKKAVRHEDHGDSDWYWMPNGFIAVLSYPGNSSIQKGGNG